MTSRALTKNDFKQKNLTKWEITTVAVHILISLAFWTLNEFDLVPPQDLKGLISGYYFVVPFAVVGLFFRNLRNFRFYLTWVFVAIGQFIIYLNVDGIVEFSYQRGTAFSGLKALLPTLIVFQMFRIFLLKTQDRELIVTMRKGRFSMWEEQDKRNMTWIEVVFSMLLAGVILTFNVV